MRLGLLAVLVGLALTLVGCGDRDPVGAAAGEWTLDVYGPIEQMLTLADSLAKENPEKPELAVSPADRARLQAFRSARYELTLARDRTARLVTSGVPDTPDSELAGTWEQRGDLVTMSVRGSTQTTTMNFVHREPQLTQQGTVLTLRRK